MSWNAIFLEDVLGTGNLMLMRVGAEVFLVDYRDHNHLGPANACVPVRVRSSSHVDNRAKK